MVFPVGARGNSASDFPPRIVFSPKTFVYVTNFFRFSPRLMPRVQVKLDQVCARRGPKAVLQSSLDFWWQAHCWDQLSFIFSSTLQMKFHNDKAGPWWYLVGLVMNVTCFNGWGTIWHQDNLTPRTIWHRTIWHRGQFDTGQFDTMGKNGQFDTADNLTPWVKTDDLTP